MVRGRLECGHALYQRPGLGQWQEGSAALFGNLFR